jgi:hypothetical protein
MRRPLTSSLCLLAALGLACADPGDPVAGGPDASSTGDAAPDAASEPDASEPDASEPDAGEPDAGEPDASEPDAGALPDGGFSGSCPVPPSPVDGPFAAGPPPASANLLLTDTASQAVFRLALDGRVLATWTALPVRNLYGVSHDRRAPTGFFVSGDRRGVNDRSMFRLSDSGAVTAALPVSSGNNTNRGIVHVPGPSPDLDLVLFLATDTLTGVRVATPERWLERLMSRAGSGQWHGLHVERYACDDGATLLFWTTRAGGILELWDWQGIRSPLRAHVLPGTQDARGIARTPRGDLYVVDRQNRRVLHLAPNLDLIDSFPTPGPQPADLSYGE